MAQHLEKTRYSIKPPDVPSGSKAFDIAIEYSRRAIREVYDRYPFMAKRLPALIPDDRIHILPKNEVHKLEQEHKPKDDILLYRALILAGLSDEQAEQRLYPTSNNWPFYLAQTGKPELYIVEESLRDLSAQDPSDRREGLIRVGQYYIEAGFQALVEPQDVPPNLHDLARLVLKDHLEFSFLENIRRSVKTGLNENLLEQVKEMIHGLLDSKKEGEVPRIVVLGGRFKLLLPGQSLVTAEFGTGELFDLETRSFIMLPVVAKLIGLLENNLIITNGHTRYRVPDILRTRSSAGQRRLASIGLEERGEIVEDYLTSGLLFRVLAVKGFGTELRQFIQ